MDAERFDRIVMHMGGRGSRRGMLGLLATLPLLGGLFALLEADDLDAQGRRKRRKKRHKHGKGRRRKHKKSKCKPHARTRTCAGKCGPVKNNCKKTVDCGSCECEPSCDECFVCNEKTRTCGADPAQQGDPCGSTGQVCQADGSCACDADSCPAGRVCVDGSCVPDPGTCAAGQNLCHDGVAPCGDHPGCQCVTTTSSATFCGMGSATCSDCSSDEDCTAVTGPGSVCADYSGDFCSCRQTGRRACVAPCGQCTNNAQCGGGICCNGACNFECCTPADCGANETCEGGICVCPGCRSRINNRCEVGDAWAQCGADGDRCTECAGGQVCTANRQTCASCAFGQVTRGTYCEIRENFGKYQCGPNCACAAASPALGECINAAATAYCHTGSEPICEFAADCVIAGLGDDCILAGECEPGCNRTVCVTRCGAGADNGSPQLVVLN